MRVIVQKFVVIGQNIGEMWWFFGFVVCMSGPPTTSRPVWCFLSLCKIWLGSMQ